VREYAASGCGAAPCPTRTASGVERLVPFGLSAGTTMSLTRREFLAGPAALAAGTLVPGGLLAAVISETPAIPDLSDWSRVRAQFVLDPEYLHFASFFIAS